MKRRLLGVVSALGLIAVAAWPVGHEAVAGAADEVPRVSVSTTSGISDGQAVIVTINTNETVPVFAAEAALCRGGVTYQSTVGTPPDDFGKGSANCPLTPISSSSDAFVSDNLTLQNSQRPEGESFVFRLGSGSTTWTYQTTDGQSHDTDLTCDQTHACSLVVELKHRASMAEGEPNRYKPFVFPIAYGVSDPIAGCGGPADGVLATGAGDRMTDAWIKWTVGACDQLHIKAPGRASFVGEGVAVSQFDLGVLDLAYTATGTNPDVKLDPLHDPSAPHRPAVAVPLAISAGVIGVAGGTKAADGHKVPYKTLKLTAEEAAVMFAGGRYGIEQVNGPNATAEQPRPYAEDIAARNPELTGGTGLFDSVVPNPVLAMAGAESFSWYSTRYFKALAPAAWKIPDLPVFGAERGKAREVGADLAQAIPGFPAIEGSTALLTGRPALRKGLIGPTVTSEGGIWVLTDLVTAQALDLTQVQLQDSAGHFVAPTPDSLRAALPGTKADAQGIRISDPAYATAQNGTQPYPLTFVEYALAPTEPLLNDDCSPRANSQKLLKDWLTHITGPGQADLPKGMVPLPDDLKAQAATEIAKVGTAPVTGPCAEVESTEGPAVVDPPAAAPDTAAEEAAAVVASMPTPDLAQSTLASVLGTAPPLNLASTSAPAPPDAGPPADTGGDNTFVATVAAIPPYIAAHVPSAIWVILALALVMALVTVALYTTSKTR
ncbi:MAG TPA: hypothetical protein VFB78_12095 [Acidimicrobiales bacterium]|nr:hypothetical protein [Acidimicrobiales bacterium]